MQVFRVPGETSWMPEADFPPEFAGALVLVHPAARRAVAATSAAVA
ncbi:hypothetical protein [Streptomyces rimosus]